MSCQHFRENHPDCTECNRNPIINAAEKRSKYSLRNTQRREVCKIKVDGCVIAQAAAKKCDYLFLSCDTNKSFFIELKGSDLSTAIDQLDSTIEQLMQQLLGYSHHARVVLTKTQTPDIRSNKYVKFQKKMKRLGGNFKHTNIIMEETLD